MRHSHQTIAAALLALALLSAPTAAAQEVRLDAPAWRALNVFLSAFSEADLPPFRRGEVDDATLARFGVMHHVAVGSAHIEPVPGRSGYQRLAARDVEAAVAEYFDRPLAHGTTRHDDGWLEYADGSYVFPVNDVEARPVAQVVRLERVGDDEFVAAVRLIVVLDGGADVYATPAADLRAAGFEVYDAGARRARIRRACAGGRERNVLVEWLAAP